MKTHPHPGPHEPTEAEIAHEAYRRWLESGQAPNRDLENWHAAREFLRHHHGHTVHQRHAAATATAAKPKAKR
jgi:hypothetical protein